MHIAELAYLQSRNHDPVYSTYGGREVVSVRVNTAGAEARAVLYRTDYEAFVAAHGVKAWILQKDPRYPNYKGRLVTHAKKHQAIVIALIISGLRQVSYRDKNPLNLKRENLYVRDTDTVEKRRKERAKVQDYYAARRQQSQQLHEQAQQVSRERQAERATQVQAYRQLTPEEQAAHIAAVLAQAKQINTTTKKETQS